MMYVIVRIRDHTAEYASHLDWTQDVRFARSFTHSDWPVHVPANARIVPVDPALNQDGVCLVSQDNPRLKECKRHG